MEKKSRTTNMEISTYSKRIPTDYTYSKSEDSISSNPLDAYRRNHSDNRQNIIAKGGKDDRSNKTNK